MSQKQQKFSLSDPELTDDNYYSNEMNWKYCSASQYMDMVGGRPFLPSCEARAMATLRGEYKPETTKAMLIGSILDCLWELEDLDYSEKLQIIGDRFPECLSSRGKTKNELKSEYKLALKMYERTLQDPLFRQFMSGEKQKIFVGSISDVPFKIKIDSYIPDTAIVDLKTTQNTSMNHRKYVADSGNWETFYRGYDYVTQLAIYREIVRQNTGKTLRCFLACIDKCDHPLPMIIELTPKSLDEALEVVKTKVPMVKMLKSGEVKNLCRCEECDYCRDTYKCKVLSSEEFETQDER